MPFKTFITSGKYKQLQWFSEIEPTKPTFEIKGKLKRSDRKQFTMNNSRSGSDKTVYLDENNQEFIKQRGFYWKFPEEIEY